MLVDVGFQEILDPVIAGSTRLIIVNEVDVSGIGVISIDRNDFFDRALLIWIGHCHRARLIGQEIFDNGHINQVFPVRSTFADDVEFPTAGIYGFSDDFKDLVITDLAICEQNTDARLVD